jgi:hypothetical protein
MAGVWHSMHRQASWVMAQVNTREEVGKGRCVAGTSLCTCGPVCHTFLFFFQLPNLASGGQSTICLGLIVWVECVACMPETKMGMACY